MFLAVSSVHAIWKNFYRAEILDGLAVVAHTFISQYVPWNLFITLVCGINWATGQMAGAWINGNRCCIYYLYQLLFYS